MDISHDVRVHMTAHRMEDGLFIIDEIALSAEEHAKLVLSEDAAAILLNYTMKTPLIACINEHGTLSFKINSND